MKIQSIPENQNENIGKSKSAIPGSGKVPWVSWITRLMSPIDDVYYSYNVNYNDSGED